MASPLRSTAELFCTTGRLISSMGGAITRAGDCLYNQATGIRFVRTKWDHANPNWSKDFYAAFGKRVWNTPELRRIVIDFGVGEEW